MVSLFCRSALLPDGWARDVRIDIAADGAIAGVAADAEPGGSERAAGPVVPGMPNLHSHAFQRAMAGLAERAGPDGDGFWTWREAMYRFVAQLTPDQLEAVAAQLYVEMLKAGYTAVAEFHYLHHDPAGRPYADIAETSRRVAAAASRAGIGLTLLPVLYAAGGFGGAPPDDGQRRFVTDPDGFLRIVDAMRAAHAGDPGVRIGVAPHSLRAVPPDLLAEVLAAFSARDGAGPVHIHVAEQEKEVADCIAWSGARPVAWLLDHAGIDGRWCLVHATHMTPEEIRRLAASGAVAGLCPTTEANLGDGLFPAPAYLAAGGAFGVGSDSNVSVSPVEELRWLEYGQRLVRRRRNCLADAGASVGAALWRAALAGGARAVARPVGALAAGRRADLVVLAGDHPALYGREDDLLLDALVFAGNANPVRDVMVGGDWVVREGRHAGEDGIADAYRAALRGLTE